MNNTKKTPRAASSRLRYPAGYGKISGQFVQPDLLDEFLAAQASKKRALSRQKKLEHDRNLRKKARDRRGLLMAKPDGVTTKSEIRSEIKFNDGWGRLAVGKMREQIKYKWYGLYRIEGSSKALAEVLREAGSEPKIKKLPTADERYGTLVHPSFGRYTPAEAETRVPDHAQTEGDKYARMGVQVTYLGAFYTLGGK